ERPTRGAAAAEHAVVLLEDLSDLGDRAVAVVGHSFDEEERARWARAFVEDFFVGRAFELAGAALDGSVDRVVRHRLTLRVADRFTKARVAGRIAAAHTRGDGELFDELREELAALCVERALL